MSDGNSFTTHQPTILISGELKPMPWITLQNYAQVAQNVHFYQVDNHPSVKDRKLVSNIEGAFIGIKGHDGYYKSNIVVQSDAWIGEYATIMGGVTVGYGAIVGAFSVVDNDIPPYAVVYGNRATIRGYRFKPEQIEALLRIKWWDFPRREIYGDYDMLDVDTFIQKYDREP